MWKLSLVRMPTDCMNGANMGRVEGSDTGKISYGLQEINMKSRREIRNQASTSL